jgi:hypothetical protein
MAVLHQPAAPSVMAECSGSPLPRYGHKGDVCAAEGCGALLSPYNPFDTCERCQRRGHEPHKRRRETPQEPTFDAAPDLTPARRPTREELELAAAQQRKRGEAKAAVLAFVQQHGGWTACSEVAKGAGVSTGRATVGLQHWWQEGKLERRKGERGYEYRARGGERDVSLPVTFRETMDDVAPTPSTAPAPEPDREQPASAAAEAATPSAPPPFAGITVLEVSTEHDAEIRVLQLLDELADERRERVLQFAVSKWWLPR